MGGIAEATEDIDNFTVTFVPGANERKATDIISGLSSGWYITKKAWDDPDKRAAAVSFISDMTTDENVSLFAQTAATALKNGVTLDTASLNSLQIDSLDMVKAATGVTGAAQDLCTQEQRAQMCIRDSSCTDRCNLRQHRKEEIHRWYRRRCNQSVSEAGR